MSDHKSYTGLVKTAFTFHRHHGVFTSTALQPRRDGAGDADWRPREGVSVAREHETAVVTSKNIITTLHPSPPQGENGLTALSPAMGNEELTILSLVSKWVT